jgi:hypothetical protein
MARRKLTDEEKKAASERLAKAREARGHDGRMGVHESIRDYPEDHYLHWKKVKQWIKSCELELKGMRHLKNSTKWQERSQHKDLEVYIYNMKKYLSGGVWLDFRYGEDREHKIKYRCLAKAYDDEDKVKRTIGVWYDDVGMWTKELEEEYEG